MLCSCRHTKRLANCKVWWQYYAAVIAIWPDMPGVCKVHLYFFCDWGRMVSWLSVTATVSLGFQHIYTTQLFTGCLTHTYVAFAEAKFLARQAAERLLAFQMQQSEAELNQGDDRC